MPRDKKIPKKNSNPTSDVVKKRKSKTVDNKVKGKKAKITAKNTKKRIDNGTG